jgi:hypothetical protein
MPPKYKAMSQKRMLETEVQLEGEIAALLRKAEQIDAQENARYRQSGLSYWKHQP